MVLWKTLIFSGEISPDKHQYLIHFCSHFRAEHTNTVIACYQQGISSFQHLMESSISSITHQTVWCSPFVIILLSSDLVWNCLGITVQQIKDKLKKVFRLFPQVGQSRQMPSFGHQQFDVFISPTRYREVGWIKLFYISKSRQTVTQGGTWVHHSPKEFLSLANFAVKWQNFLNVKTIVCREAFHITHKM